MKDILKKINKKEKVIIGVTLGVIVITLISVIVKDTHAFYNSETTPIQIFKTKIGNFKPIINSFYIKENNIQPKYTNQNINTVYLSWGSNNKNINEMCITEGDINSCNWQAINTSTQYTFATETEGAKLIKGYIRDKAGNKSLEKSDTIIYDKTAPTINKVGAITTTENSISISVTANEDLSGVTEYCYATVQTGPYTCKSENTNQYTGLEGGKEYTFWIYLKDKAGNGTETNATQYKFKTKTLIKNYLQEKGGETFKEQSGMYRFIGYSTQVKNNYICFGTNNVETCKKTPGTYMYRIIGVTSADDDTLGLKANQLKLIKATPSSTSQLWHSSNTDIKWDDSDIKEYLNKDFLEDAVSKWENGSKWQGLITSQKWYNADQRTTPAASAEPTTSHTDEESKIGLMYATDYTNAYSRNTSNWLFITNGWTGNSSTSEWTMSRYGLNVDYYSARFVADYNGALYTSAITAPFTVRPVFYLTPGITLTGEGTTTDPFIIAS